MVIVDVIAGAVIAGAFFWGLRSGLRRMLPIAGFAAGALVGSRLPLLFGGKIDGDFSLVAAIPGALILGALAAAWAERRGSRLRRFSRARPRANQISGALATGAAAMVMLWFLAPVVAELRAARNEIDRSEVLAQLNSVLKPAGPDRNKTLPQVDNFPRFAGETPDIAQGVAGIVSDPDVLKADESVVKIRVRGCGGGGNGSGWLAADGIIVTNAHVVSQGEEITVQRQGKGAPMTGVPIWFDARNDVALLRVDRLKGVKTLPIVRDVRAGTPAASLGFPRGRHVIARARVGPTTKRLRGEMNGSMPPEFPRELNGRLVTTFRGKTEPGSSGGPVVDAQGRVVTTTFGGGNFSSSLGVPNEIVLAALRSRGPRVSVGDCDDER